MTEAPYAAASVRNSEPILGVLRHELKHVRRLLEIGSGTGYHAVTFAAALPGLTWQTSDLEESHDWIRDSIARAGLANVKPPLTLDMRTAKAEKADPEKTGYELVYSCNTAHIMGFDVVRKMLQFVGHSLVAGGRFIYYGPFRRSGHFSTASNAAFDESLRGRRGDMGIREIDDVDTIAAICGMQRQRTYAMPANNLLAIWKKR